MIFCLYSRAALTQLPASEELGNRVDAIAKQMLSRHAAGGSVAVARHGCVIFARGYGMANVEHSVPVTPQTVFHIASLSKNILAAVVLQLVDPGKLQLDGGRNEVCAGGAPTRVNISPTVDWNTDIPFPGTLLKASFMSFILVPSEGEDLQVNAWNWRPTLKFLFAAGVITENDYELLGFQGSGGRVNAEKADQMANAVTQKLASLNPGERMLADLSVSSEPKKKVVFSPDNNVKDIIDTDDLYSTTLEWLQTFVTFCRRSGGFHVM